MEAERRKTAVQRHVLGGETPKAVYTDLGRSKKWFFKWLKRYQTGAADWYKEPSRAPKTSPSKIAAPAQESIVRIRQHLEAQPYAQIGVAAIKWELTKLKMPFPSDSTINRVLRSEGLVKKNRLCPQGGGISLFHRGPVRKQPPTDGFIRAALHQG